jgi:quercetin dioxygenase-like cupin family protein
MPETSTVNPEAFWFDNMLMKVRLGADEAGGRLSIIEQIHFKGYGTPTHVHENEDQTLVVLSGAITAWLGDESATYGPGDAVFLPRGVEHAFVVDEDDTRVLEINTPGGFENFHIQAGEPATHDGLPDPKAPDIEKLARVGAEFSCRIVGPPKNMS